MLATLASLYSHWHDPFLVSDGIKESCGDRLESTQTIQRPPRSFTGARAVYTTIRQFTGHSDNSLDTQCTQAIHRALTLCSNG